LVEAEARKFRSASDTRADSPCSTIARLPRVVEGHMRREWLPIAFAISCATAGAEEQISWGIRGGYAHGWLDTSGQDAFETDADGGYAIGAFASVALGASMRFQSEILWTSRRFSAREAAVPFSISARGVELPLLFQLRFPEGRRAQATVFAGPQLSLVTSVEQALGDSETDIGDQVRNLDAGVTVGGGFEWLGAQGAFLLDLRVNLAFAI
jgi:hypothetical protein